MLGQQLPMAQLVTVKASDGLLLPALFFEPNQKSKRLVIWLHGMGSSGIFYSVEHTNALADAFTHRHTAFLGLQNRGGGMLQSLKFYDDKGEKQRRLQGTTHELIVECRYDIEGAITFAVERGYTELFIGGHSTGANKVALYNFLKSDNPFAGYILYGGGDDTGIFYEDLGKERFEWALSQAKQKINEGRGEELAPFEMMDDYFSYQSAYDILDPDGRYNTFPYFEAQSGTRLGKKPLFQEYKSIHKPTLVIYGAQDPFCRPNVSAIMVILRRESSQSDLFTYKQVVGADHGGHPFEDQIADNIASWVAETSGGKSL
jgi:pimeloyl-ACP methyl ester carboxylesterase